MSNQHTPGPWKWGEDWEKDVFPEDEDDEFGGSKYADFQLYGSGNQEILPIRVDHHDLIFDAFCEPDFISKADRLLIAAAPELLEALRDMLSGWRYIRDSHGDLYGVGWDRAQNKAESALAKATGKELS